MRHLKIKKYKITTIQHLYNLTFAATIIIAPLVLLLSYYAKK